jgi:NADPH-dependent curcumin reductase CurA
MIPESAYLSTLGLTGITAYFGMLEIGQPKEKDVVVVSGAAGAVGSIAGQIARLKGCRVVGITGSDLKVAFLKQELHFDEAINYKKFSNLRKPLKEACPGGIDIYFDNVGGEISDSVMYLLNDHSRIVLCGQIALYNLGRMDRGPRMGPQLLIHRTRMQGFNVYDYRSRFSKATKEISTWLINGHLKGPVNIICGFENIPEAFLGLFRGDNIGKQLVKL